jgi:DNA repair protein RadC
MPFETVDKLNDVDLIAAVLGKTKPDAECLQISNMLISKDWTDTSVMVQETAPLSQRKQRRIDAAIELGTRTMAYRASKKITAIATPEDVQDLLAPRYHGLEREMFLGVCLNTKNHIIKIVEVSIGSLNASIVHPRELFRMAVQCSAASLVVVHNHPSGDPTPSGADIQLTRRLTKAGDLLGIEVLDHVILGPGGELASLRDLGLM